MPMNVIAWKKLKTFADRYPDALEPLDHWYKLARKANYTSFADVKEDFGSADWVGGYIVFNIGGNKYRLIVFPNFEGKRLLVEAIFTHKEYDAWKP
ncbi:type II toxin-antitoxin system HigB family toxin [Deinococcus cavernae]|nr:type II toxin-antitoxin system HigB family toxin [Deinococcus cavernae]